MSQVTDPIVASQPTDLSFEAGYERLQEIAGRLNQDEVPVSEMCDLFAEGKGLEIALTGFLDTQRERVEAIERGEGIRAFRISRPPGLAPAVSPAAERLGAGDIPIDTEDFVPPPTRSDSSPVVADDDLPF